MNCKGCGKSTTYRERLHQFKHYRYEVETEYCPSCRQHCEYCDDWMGIGPDEVTINGKRYHKLCAEDMERAMKESA